MNNKNKLLCGTLFVYLFAMAASLVSTTAFAIGGYTWDAGTSICTDDLSGLPVDPVFCNILPPGGGGGGGAGGAGGGAGGGNTPTVIAAKKIAAQAAVTTTNSFPIFPQYPSSDDCSPWCMIMEQISALMEASGEGGSEGQQGQAVMNGLSGPGGGVSPNIKPSTMGFTSDDYYVQSSFTYKKISDDASLLGTSQKMRAWNLTAGMRKDFDNWGFFLAIPVTKTFNNDSYSALDSTSAGIQFTPEYHFLVEQVHKVGVDFGAQLGYSKTWYDDLSEIKSSGGSFGLATYENTSTANLGAYIRAQAHLTGRTAATVHIGVADYVNLENESLLGRTTTALDIKAGLRHTFTERFYAFANVSKTHLKLHSFDSTYDYGMLGLGASYVVNSRGKLSLSAERSFSDGFMETTRGMLQFQYALD